MQSDHTGSRPDRIDPESGHIGSVTGRIERKFDHTDLAPGHTVMTFDHTDLAPDRIGPAVGHMTVSGSLLVAVVPTEVASHMAPSYIDFAVAVLPFDRQTDWQKVEKRYNHRALYSWKDLEQVATLDKEEPVHKTIAVDRYLTAAQIDFVKEPRLVYLPVSWMLTPLSRSCVRSIDRY